MSLIFSNELSVLLFLIQLLLCSFESILHLFNLFLELLDLYLFSSVFILFKIYSQSKLFIFFLSPINLNFYFVNVILNDPFLIIIIVLVFIEKRCELFFLKSMISMLLLLFDYFFFKFVNRSVTILDFPNDL